MDQEIEGVLVNAKTVLWHLGLAHYSPVHYRRCFCVIPNASWGMGLPFEADVLAINKSGYMTEVEIKVSMSDWRKDMEKRKHLLGHQSHVRRFYYAAPMKLAKRYQEIEGLPAYAGVIGVGSENLDSAAHLEILKSAEVNTSARRLRDKEMMNAARLSALRVWTMIRPEELT